MEKIKAFIQTKTGQQIYSFVKTYIVVFISICYFAIDNGTDIFTLSFMVAAIKTSALSVIRNIYKLATE